MTNETLDPVFAPPIPSVRLGELKDMAQEVVTASATLDGRIAAETARALGDRLRFLNSYHSNLIEGHKTSVLEIEAALASNFSKDDQKRYAQELCAAHVRAERELMDEVLSDPPENICGFDFIGKIHKRFYEQLPRQHQFTHSHGGFTRYSVMPGQMRDRDVSLDGSRTPHGPNAGSLPAKLAAFAREYNSANFHGDERLIVAAD